ncbi:transcription elongation factor 1 homolog isoform X4 [Drosophila kikkawai]|uniref:Transcription elongation factor 1 homolog n=1 Tax=Drosophila kikkawai TaxID=30033 RepID=A0ABM4GE28_DROKI
MGRRKSKRKPPPKRKNIEPLDQQFNCPFCNHEKSCEVKIPPLQEPKVKHCGGSSMVDLELSSRGLCSCQFTTPYRH